ncbi:MAG TPA: hypothetical protein VM577_14880 [Anaerovoracaceae bacterium]|nr:hypothetical protein [Anaerovoracaceae bacterium]
MTKKLYDNLVKPILFRDGPKGLYPKPLYWMEGKDLEGYNGNVGYTFVTEPTTFHPMEGLVAHPYDEILVFAGLDKRDILYLGGEVSIEIGEEREEYAFTEPTVVCIPKGVPHGQVKVRRVYKTFAHYFVGLAAQYEATAISAVGNVKSGGKKYAHLVKKLVTHVPEGYVKGSGMGYEEVTDERGVMLPATSETMQVGPGNADELIWMFGDDLEHFEVNFTWGHYTRSGKWHRMGETHTHPEEEILCFFPAEPDHLDDLGCEMEFGMGAEREREIFSKPTIVVCPKGFPHLPEITRWCDRMYIFIVICMSGLHDSPWIEIPE